MVSEPVTVSESELAERHVGLVRMIAHRMRRHVPEYEHDDLESYGYLGLVDAARRFDQSLVNPELGSLDYYFEAFAKPRILGAMKDGLRAKDWAPRQVRAAVREVERARELLEVDLGRTVTPAEIAEHLGVEESVVLAAERDVKATIVDPVALLPSSSHDEDEDTEHHPVHLPSDLAGEAEVAELVRLIAVALSRLPAENQQVVLLRYREDLKLAHVGRRLGLARGRVTALRDETCMLLREHLAVLT